MRLKNALFRLRVTYFYSKLNRIVYLFKNHLFSKFSVKSINNSQLVTDCLKYACKLESFLTSDRLD